MGKSDIDFKLWLTYSGHAKIPEHIRFLLDPAGQFCDHVLDKDNRCVNCGKSFEVL